VEESKVETRLGLHGGNSPVTKPGYSGWVEEKPTMRFESERLDAIDNNFGCTILVWDIYRSRPVLVVQPRICPDQLATLFALVVPLLPPSSGPFGTEYDRG
jgi:hypothetical protein